MSSGDKQQETTLGGQAHGENRRVHVVPVLCASHSMRFWGPCNEEPGKLHTEPSAAREKFTSRCFPRLSKLSKQ